MYLVFAGRYWYPAGGVGDLKNIVSSIKEAKKWYKKEIKNNNLHWCQIVESKK